MAVVSAVGFVVVAAPDVVVVDTGLDFVGFGAAPDFVGAVVPAAEIIERGSRSECCLSQDSGRLSLCSKCYYNLFVELAM